MTKYYVSLFLLCFCGGERYNLYGMRPTDEENKVTLNYYCGYCCKREVIETFKLYQRCKKTHYCSINCQRTDWPVHKTKCPHINLDQERKSIEQIRNAIIDQQKVVLTDKEIDKVQITAVEEELILRKIETYGVQCMKDSSVKSG